MPKACAKALVPPKCAIASDVLTAPILGMPIGKSIGVRKLSRHAYGRADNVAMPKRTLGQRVREAREELGWKQGELARRAGLSQASISDIESGNTQPEFVKATTLVRIAKALGKDISYLTGRREPNTEEEIGVLSFRAPIISWVQAGRKQAVIDAYQPGVAEDWEEYTVPASKLAFALRVRGDSMTPDFPEGTVIIVDPAVSPKNGDYVVVRFNDTDEATFKKLVIDGPTKVLRPLNPAYPTIQLSEDAQLAGVVVEANLRRKFR